MDKVKITRELVSKEDAIKVYVDHLRKQRDRTDLPKSRCRGGEYSGRIDSVLETLRLLDIKIVGVNHD